jgi:hypothetical protein
MRYRLRTLLIVAPICRPAIGLCGVMQRLNVVNNVNISLLLIWMLVSAVAINCTFDGISWFLRRVR